MSKYKLKDGWTKQKVMEVIKKENNGTTASDRYGQCQYLVEENGNKCLVGCFIPADEYNEDMEENSAERLLEGFPELRQYMPMDDEGMQAMQSLHDSLDNTLEATELHSAVADFLEKRVA